MLLKSLHLENILSFGPDGVDLKLRPLNVLIGPNGSGKSNLIEIIGLLAAAPRDIQEPLRGGGGVREWICKLAAIDTAAVEAVVEPRGRPVARYRLGMGVRAGSHLPHLTETIHGITSVGTEDLIFRYEYEQGVLQVMPDDATRTFPAEALRRDQSVLAQIRSPLDSGPMGTLRSRLESVRFYDGGFALDKLPQRDNVESVSKADIQRALDAATRKTKTKGRYDKGRHSFVLLGQVDPRAVRDRSAFAARFFDALRRHCAG